MHDRSYPHDPTASPDCGIWISDGLLGLQSTLDLAAEDDMTMAAPKDLDGSSVRLSEQMRAGKLVDSIAILNRYAEQEGEEAVLSSFLPHCIRLIGTGWQDRHYGDDEVALAFATARQLINLWQSEKTGRVATPLASGPTLLAAVAPGDQHTFGTQILADTLRLQGWHVETHLSVSDSSKLLERVAENWYGAVLFSVGHDASLAGLGDLVAEIRLNSTNSSICVLVGGSSLVQPLTQYHFIGADLVAGTAAQGAAFLEWRLSQGSTGIRS